MCEFCKNNKLIVKKINQYDDRIESIVCGIKGNEISCSALIQTGVTIYPTIIAKSKVNYCPVCGKWIGKE